MITKFVDGVKQDDWKTTVSTADGPCATSRFCLAMATRTERRVWYVNSIQIQSRKLSDSELESLGKPTADGLPNGGGGETGTRSKP